MSIYSLIPPLAALLLAPFFVSIINRTKAILAGRKGAPLLQPYRDLVKLLAKGAVYSHTTSRIFQLGPLIGLASLLVCVFLVPLGPFSAPVTFSGDIILLAYLMGLGRFFTVLAALDTGSSFEGMGASREVFFSALAEPAFLLAMACLIRLTGQLSLTGILHGLASGAWEFHAPSLVLSLVAMFIVFLAENARIPVDDPATHLELTMIHEVMILDHSGPELAFIEYGVCLKIWLLAAIMAGVLVPGGPGFWTSAGLGLLAMIIIAIMVGMIESGMARLRLIRVPQLLVSASICAALALFLEFAQ